MGIRVVTDGFGVINAGLTLVAFLILALVTIALIRKATVEILKSSNEALRAANEDQKGRLFKLEVAYHAQEMRIYRVEIDAERSKRKLNQAREEIRILELAINVAVPCMAADGEHRREHGKIITLLAELTELRQKTSREMDDWEETQSSTIAFMDNRHEPQAWEGRMDKS